MIFKDKDNDKELSELKKENEQLKEVLNADKGIILSMMSENHLFNVEDFLKSGLLSEYADETLQERVQELEAEVEDLKKKKLTVKRYGNKHNLLDDLYVIEYNLKITKTTDSYFAKPKYAKELEIISSLIRMLEVELRDVRLVECQSNCPFHDYEVMGHGWIEHSCKITKSDAPLGSRCRVSNKDYQEHYKKYMSEW